MRTFYEVDGRFYNTLAEARKDHFRNYNRKIRIHNAYRQETIDRLKSALYIPEYAEVGSNGYYEPAARAFFARDQRI